MNARPDMTDAILKVEHLSMKFGGLVAIGDLSFAARRGEITALIGPNGAGKTTVFNCITGFYKPSEGMITLTGKAGKQFLLERLPDYQIPAKARVARTFQNIRLFSGMTVLENLLVAQHNKLMLASGFTVLGLLGFTGYRKASAASVDLARFWLEKANLVDRADDPAGDLPYGAQRRLEIARAMCTEPELLCLDEPAAGLNPRESHALNALLIDIKETTGTSILLIEHDMSVVMQISDHVVVLEYGRKISDGDPTSVKSDPRVIAAYLGVDDEEVLDVLVEVGDTQVIEELDGEPDRAHGPSDSASMMAGPIGDTVSHSDSKGEVMRVSPGASKAAQMERAAAKRAPSKAKPTVAKSAALTGSVKAASARPAKPAVPDKASPAKSSPAKAISAKSTAAKKAAVKLAPAKASKPVAAKSGSAAAPASSPVAKSVPAKSPARKEAAAKSAAAARRAPTKPVPKPAKPKTISNTLSAPRGGAADRLGQIKGIGPVNESKLNAHGVYHFHQIAAWKKTDIEAAEAYLAFDGRIARENWVGQAKAFAKAAVKSATARGKK